MIDTKPSSDSGETEKKVASTCLLLLPFPTNSGKSKAAMDAEHSIKWRENKLHQQMSTLDKQLSHKVMKLNVERLDVINDLAKMRKSRSTGSLGEMGTVCDKDQRESLSIATEHRRNPHECHNNTLHGEIVKRSEKHEASRRSSEQYDGIEGKMEAECGGIVIQLSREYTSSSDDEIPQTNSFGLSSNKRSPRHSPSLIGRAVSSANERSQAARLENVQRRFAKEMASKSVSLKTKLEKQPK
ncbi:hypothetical protein ACJMK2_030367 [Sinanodonta woodiana]|uniref:Uncharacterized protein n=1 Tax=Sinanodonta woodiana TaxID=1069815 RepID=A0ABD3XCZ0_SINWO